MVSILALESSILPNLADDSLGMGISSSYSSESLKTSLSYFISFLTSLFCPCLERVGFAFDDYGSSFVAKMLGETIIEGSLGFVYFLGRSLGGFFGIGLALVISPLRMSISPLDYIGGSDGAIFKVFPELGGGFSLATTTAGFITTFDSPTASSFFP